jgi:hypothetical protein
MVFSKRGSWCALYSIMPLFCKPLDKSSIEWLLTPFPLTLERCRIRRLQVERWWFRTHSLHYCQIRDWCILRVFSKWLHAIGPNNAVKVWYDGNNFYVMLSCTESLSNFFLYSTGLWSKQYHEIFHKKLFIFSKKRRNLSMKKRFQPPRENSWHFAKVLNSTKFKC